MPKINFNAASKEPMEERNFDNIPKGEYIASIIKSEIKPTKAGTGKRLNFTFKVLSGEFKGRQLFVGLNVENPNPTAVEISDRELKSICDAIGKGKENLQETEELHGIPMTIKVDIGQPSGEYKEDGETKYKYPSRNEIKGYDKAEGGEYETSATAPSNVPWDKKEKPVEGVVVEDDIPF